MEKIDVLKKHANYLIDLLSEWRQSAEERLRIFYRMNELTNIEARALLRHINSQVDNFRDTLKCNYLYYWDLSCEYRLDSLSLRNLTGDGTLHLCCAIEERFEQISAVATKYQMLIEVAQKHGIEAQQHITRCNLHLMKVMQASSPNGCMALLEIHDHPCDCRALDFR